MGTYKDVREQGKRVEILLVLCIVLHALCTATRLQRWPLMP
jgi:hypothetical protein